VVLIGWLAIFCMEKLDYYAVCRVTAGTVSD
jgi:hypothetical protein